MKKLLLSMIALLSFAVSSQAMSYEQARQQALFLADKMAYELNLTEDQYEACYEVNLDYLMGVTGQHDVYGDYWTRRNLDLSYILLDWQYEAYLAATYFYRPLYWADGFWHFGIYAHYPHRTYFYFGRPKFWDVYRGAHAWHSNGGHSWYHGRTFGHIGGKPQPRDHHKGMRDGFNRGDYGRGHDYGDKKHGDRGRMDQSSTRVTVGNTTQPGSHHNMGRRRDQGQTNMHVGQPSGSQTGRGQHVGGSSSQTGRRPQGEAVRQQVRTEHKSLSSQPMQSRPMTSQPQVSRSLSGQRSGGGGSAQKSAGGSGQRVGRR